MTESDHHNPKRLALTHAFERWQKDYYDQVDSPFAKEDKLRGMAAFASWEERFHLFLREQTPSLLPMYKKQITMHRAVTLAGMSIHRNWKRNKGEALEAFLTQCIADARADRVVTRDILSEGAPAATPPAEFIDPRRISELKSLHNTEFDARRLVRMCEEANICYNNGCYLALLMLCRAIIDHVPPIFGQDSFAQVVSGYSPKSTRASLEHLQRSLRNIADSALHTHVRRTETLPTRAQVAFSADMDVLLGEVARVLALHESATLQPNNR
jgi:hypothetical protein